MSEKDPALSRAIAVVGGVTKTAEALGISGPAVSMWVKCPLHRVADLAKLSGVPPWELAPDHYDPPAQDPV